MVFKNFVRIPWSAEHSSRHIYDFYILLWIIADSSKFFYGLTNYVINWWVKDGSMDMAGTMAGLTAVLCLMAVPMYIFGKKYRNFWHHHNLLKKLHLETDHTGAEEA